MKRIAVCMMMAAGASGMLGAAQPATTALVTVDVASVIGPIKRMNGDNITSEFLRGLPQDWLKEKPELDTTAINRLGVSGEELFKHGLYRPEKRVWSVEDAPNAQAAQGVVE